MLTKWFRRRQEVPLEQIHQRLNKLEAAIQQLVDAGLKNQIHIDTLNVHNPVLEKLEFHLDQLDIDEVSGALNLGNNFGVRVNPKQRVTHMKKDKTDPEQKSGANPHSTELDEGEATYRGTAMRKTPDGFCFRFPPK